MNGAEAFVAALYAAGAKYVFGNPGTTEQAFLHAVSKHEGIEFVLCLHEAVAVGAAEGYTRVSGEVGVVQLHTGCGLGNSLGMLSNAFQGHTPLVIFVGGPSRKGMHSEPALGGDLVGMARPVSRWVWELRTADEIPIVVARAFKVAKTNPAGPVVIVVPNDLMDEVCSVSIVKPSWVLSNVVVGGKLLDEVVERLCNAKSPALLFGDGILNEKSGWSLAQLAKCLAAPIYSSSVTHAVLPTNESLYAGEVPLFDAALARAQLSHHDLVLAIGVDLIRSVFPEPGPPLGEKEVIHIGLDPWQLGKNQPCTSILGDECLTIEALLSRFVGDTAINITKEGFESRNARRKKLTTELNLLRAEDKLRTSKVFKSPSLTPDRVISELSKLLPDDCIIIDESVSAMSAVTRWIDRQPGRWYRSRGGGLGAGMSIPIGASLARPECRVVAIVGDGSSMYTVTAMWTAAHLKLPITWIVLDNGGYRILEVNARLWHAGRDSTVPFVGTALRNPSIDIAGIATAFGLTSLRVKNITELVQCVSVFSGGPKLVQITMSS